MSSTDVERDIGKPAPLTGQAEARRSAVAPEVRLVEAADLRTYLERHALRDGAPTHPAHDLRWLNVLADGLDHEPFLLEARHDERVVATLPLAFVRSVLFGRFLVSLPYVNSAGVSAGDSDVAAALIDQAVQLANSLDCRFLELRHEAACDHPSLTEQLITKVHMRLKLPETVDDLWTGLKAKVRSQVRSGLRHSFQVEWGGENLLPDFYKLFARRMRDLGTPVYSRRLFQAILSEFPGTAEICCIRDGSRPVAAALLVHGSEIAEVPSASSDAKYNSANANMVLYWHLLARAVERRRRTFDFGRSTRDSSTYRFKKQWGAEPHPAVWQYYVRRGSMDAMRPDNSRHRRLIDVWRRLPLPLANWIGPHVVRGIP